MKGTEITCRQFIEFLMGYLDGELPPAQKEIFEAHLGICPSCVNYMNTYREAVRLGKVAMKDPEGAPPGDAPEDLIQAILKAKKGRK